jgi:4,5-dihydroxyphthalate decarboxylase
VWARSVLQDEYGVDLHTVTWVLSGDEHVAQYRPPGNVVPVAAGTTLDEMLARGELAAVIGAGIEGPGVTPLIPDPLEAGFRAMQERGLYPINHLVVIKDEVLRGRPGVATEIFDAFARAKQLYVERLRSGAITNPTATDRMYARVMESTGTDPLPYGIAPNRKTLDELLCSAVDQKILERPPAIEEVFAQDTLDLTA